MTLALYSHADMEHHQPGPGHPERSQRLGAVLDALADASDLSLLRREASLAALEDLQRVHPRAHLDRLIAASPDQGLHELDPDTFLSPGSVAAAQRAAGAVIMRSEAWSMAIMTGPSALSVPGPPCRTGHRHGLLRL